MAISGDTAARPASAIKTPPPITIFLLDGEFYVYAGLKLVRVCPSIGFAREIAAGA